MIHTIEFNDVYRHFGEQDVLRGLTLSVEPGKIYALLGRNGAGKTTALRILLGFLEPMRGRTSILGVNSRCLGPADRGRIGYLSEGHRLYSTMRVRDAVSFEAGTRSKFRRAYAEKAIARCGLCMTKFIGLLSRGQRAQLSLILAVAGEPEVLIFDDPAMGLDVVMRREFLDAMIDLLSGQGCSVLFSSHILTDVERIADRVGILHKGRLIVDADLDDIKKRVQKRRWTGPDEKAPKPPAKAPKPSAEAPKPPDMEGLLRARPVRNGYDLTLLDLDEEHEARLLEGGASLSEPFVPNLEDLFLDLTTDNDSQSPLSEFVEDQS